MTFPLPVQPYPISQDEFEELLLRVKRYLDQVSDGMGRLFDNCNRVMHWLPGYLAERLQSSLQRLRELGERFFKEMAKLVLNPGWPPKVFGAASAWTTQVGGPVSGLAAKLTRDGMRSDNEWRGPAAEAYIYMLPRQKKAVEGIKQLTDALDSTLTNVGRGVLALWGGIILAITLFLLEIFGAGAAAATVVGAPPAAAAAGLSTAKVIALIIAIVGAFMTYISLLVSSMSDLRQSLYGNEAYPDGDWPKSTVSDIRDGSLSDGDGTDWRLKH